MGDERRTPDGRPERATFRGYGPPNKEPLQDVDPVRASLEDAVAATALVAGSDGRRGRGQPAVEIDLIHERRTAPLPDHQWTFAEIWTRNTIYALDTRLRCIAVVDQHARQNHPDHALIGARLVGGQRRDGNDEGMELSHPFPRPGSEAVFEQSRGRQVRFSQTSTVTRVVLRLRVLTVASDRLLPTWEEITGQHARQVKCKDGHGPG